jgi:hypothetical protein
MTWTEELPPIPAVCRCGKKSYPAGIFRMDFGDNEEWYYYYCPECHTILSKRIKDGVFDVVHTEDESAFLDGAIALIKCNAKKYRDGELYTSKW